MAKFLPILASVIPLATSPVTVAAAPSTTGAQSSTQQQSSAALSSMLTQRTLSIETFINFLTDTLRNEATPDLQSVLTAVDFRNGITARFSAEADTLKQSIESAFMNAPLTDSLSLFLTKFKEFVKSNPGINIGKNDADKQKFTDFINQFKTICDGLTDHSITTMQNVNAMAANAFNVEIVLKNPPKDVSVSSLGTYFVAKRINDVPGDNLFEYFAELNKAGSPSADLLNATKFDDDVSFDYFQLIDKDGVISPIEALVDKASTKPKEDIAKYGLSALNDMFDAEIARIKAESVKKVSDKFDTFDGARTANNFKEIIDELSSEESSTGGSSPIASNLAAAKDNLLSVLHKDIDTMLSAHVKLLSYNDVKPENIDKLTIEKLIDPNAWKVFIDKWNKSINPTSFGRTITVKPGASPIDDAEATLTLTIKNGASDAIVNPVVDANGVSTYKWNPVKIPVKITLKDFITELQKLVDNNNLGTPNDDEKITTLNFGQILMDSSTPPKPVYNHNPSVFKFDSLENLMRLLPNLNSIYPIHGPIPSNADMTFLQKFPGLAARVVGAKIVASNALSKTADIETTIRFYENDADYTSDSNFESITIVVKGIPYFDSSALTELGNAFRKMIETVNPKDINSPEFFGLELSNLLQYDIDINHSDIIAQQNATSITLPFNDLVQLLGQRSENGDMALGYLTDMLDGKSPSIINPLESFPKIWDYIISGSLIATRPNVNSPWTAKLSYVVTSELDGNFKSQVMSANVMVITLDQFITKAISDFNHEAQPFLDLANQLHSDGTITDAQFANILKMIQDAKDKLKTDLAKPDIKTKADVIKTFEDAKKALKLTQVEAITNNLPNANTQTEAAKKDVVDATTAFTAAQTALDSATKHEADVNADPASSDKDKADALEALQKAQTAFDEAKTNLDVKTSVLTDILKHIGVAHEIVAQGANKDSSTYASILNEAADYLNTANLASIDELEAFKKLADMPLFEHVSLSMPMKYALIGLGGLMGLVGVGATFSTLRSIKTNRNISQIGENASIEYQKPKKTMALKSIVSIAALGAAASIITLVLTLGGGL